MRSRVSEYSHVSPVFLLIAKTGNDSDIQERKEEQISQMWSLTQGTKKRGKKVRITCFSRDQSEFNLWYSRLSPSSPGVICEPQVSPLQSVWSKIKQKMEEIPAHATTLMLSERSQTHKICLVYSLEKLRAIRFTERKEVWGCQCWSRQQKWSYS